MSVRMIAFGLGSNVGERAKKLAEARHAIAYMDGVQPDSLHASSIIETAALLPEGAPEAWNIPFLNQVIIGKVTEAIAKHPEALLLSIKAIEKRLGRQDRGHWSPREIDVDIIAIEGVIYHSPTLTIPHPLAHTRMFVLEPLLQLWPECVLNNSILARQAWESVQK
jgi:2-amino-4-hydroxy-6-hydroxymethyldihydropteridine diphosphokinase